eukprot:1177784-Prorocentrum_minimum.AAC.1
MAYGIGTGIFGVGEMAVDTILMAFLIDSEKNGGVAVNAPPELADSLEHLKKECNNAADPFKRGGRQPGATATQAPGATAI